MEISISDFIKALDEINRVNNMALRYAVQILADFRNLTPEGRRVMTDTLVELISNVTHTAGLLGRK